MFCIDKAIGFITEKDHLKIVSEWILTGKVSFGDEEIKVELTADQKYQVIKSYWASPHFTLDEKKALRTKALEGDGSDNAMIVSKVCEWSLPDQELKKKLWSEITDLSSKEALKELNLKMQGFWQRRQQLDLIEPYFDQYYSILEKVVEVREREFAESFMNNLSPAFMARETDEKTFT